MNRTLSLLTALSTVLGTACGSYDTPPEGLGELEVIVAESSVQCPADAYSYQAEGPMVTWVLYDCQVGESTGTLTLEHEYGLIGDEFYIDEVTADLEVGGSVVTTWYRRAYSDDQGSDGGVVGTDHVKYALDTLQGEIWVRKVVYSWAELFNQTDANGPSLILNGELIEE